VFYYLEDCFINSESSSWFSTHSQLPNERYCSADCTSQLLLY